MRYQRRLFFHNTEKQTKYIQFLSNPVFEDILKKTDSQFSILPFFSKICE